MCVEKTPWEQVIDFHGHTCPEIAIGFRVAQIAMRELGINPAPEPMITVTAYTHSCALDAFQIINRATYGRGSLIVKEKNLHTYHFQKAGMPEVLEITVRSEIIEHLVGTEEQLSKREKQNKNLEAIRFILGTEERLFCNIQSVINT